MSSDGMAAALAGALGRAGHEVAVEDLRRLSGGANQETWAFAALTPAGPRDLILRRAPGGHDGAAAAAGMALETRVISVARSVGVPAPEVIVLLVPEDGLGAGYVMTRAQGETLARKILRDAAFDAVRPRLARQCGRVLAHLHTAPAGGIADLPRLDGPTQLRQYRERYRSYGQPKPVFELAFAWLEPRLAAVERPALVHGDFRHGNLMVHPERGLEAVLDWELTHLGDPREDLGWICVNSWRFGADRRVGGFGDLDDLLGGYVEAGGEPFTEADIRLWEMLGVLKWGVGCMSMYEVFRSGHDRSVERAAIGRRSSECEIDLLNLLAA